MSGNVKISLIPIFIMDEENKPVVGQKPSYIGSDSSIIVYDNDEELILEESDFIFFAGRSGAHHALLVRPDGNAERINFDVSAYGAERFIYESQVPTVHPERGQLDVPKDNSGENTDGPAMASPSEIVGSSEDLATGSTSPGGVLLNPTVRKVTNNLPSGHQMVHYYVVGHPGFPDWYSIRPALESIGKYAKWITSDDPGGSSFENPTRDLRESRSGLLKRRFSITTAYVPNTENIVW